VISTSCEVELREYGGRGEVRSVRGEVVLSDSRGIVDRGGRLSLVGACNATQASSSSGYCETPIVR